jgi:SAM-dependent methyltransferase
MSTSPSNRLYDKIGATYDANAPCRARDPRACWRKCSTSKQGADVLDIGCGTGNYTTALGDQYGLEMLGSTLRPDAAHRAARRQAGVAPDRRPTPPTCPCPNRGFDGAICTLAIHHFDDLGSLVRGRRNVCWTAAGW